MGQPLEVKLVGHRRVLLDVDGADWRVAFYFPTDPTGVRNLESSAKAGSESAQAALSALEMGRSTARSPKLSEALTRAMSVRIGSKTTVPSIKEVVEIEQYVLALGYVGREAS